MVIGLMAGDLSEYYEIIRLNLILWTLYDLKVKGIFFVSSDASLIWNRKFLYVEKKSMSKVRKNFLSLMTWESKKRC